MSRHEPTHLHTGPTPACDCNPDRPRPGILAYTFMIYGIAHAETCALVVERRARLLAGTGGTR